MRYALVCNQLEVPQKGISGFCPGCKGHVIAKCGTKIVHHWAHKSGVDCDTWHEPITRWHLDWQEKFPVHYREKVLFDLENQCHHRADICTNNNVIIEFQHSAISPEELHRRELFYDKLIWVVNAQAFNGRFQLGTWIPDPKEASFKEVEFSVNKHGLTALPVFHKRRDAQTVVDFDLPRRPFRTLDTSAYELDLVRPLFEDLKKTFRLFTWNNKHHVWFLANSSVFFDLGDEYLWRLKTKTQLTSNFYYLQVYNKSTFVGRYQK